MFFTKIFQFFRGYVILSLTGHSIERFINICTHRLIPLISIQKHKKNKAVVKMYRSDFYLIRPIAFKTRTKIHILKKGGLPTLIRKYRRRYVMMAGCVLCVLIMLISSQFIWFIEYEGVNVTDIAMLQSAVEKAGIHVGIAKQKLPSGVDMKNTILNSTDGISWVWVYVKGTKATVQIKESVHAPEMVDKDKPCDIVSMSDGVVQSVTAKVGDARVMRGDAVLKGDILIAGTQSSEVVNYRLCHAIGTVQAYTYHKKAGEYKLYKEIRTPTGKKKTHFTLNLFSKKIPLFKSDSISYAEYDTISKDSHLNIGDYYFGIGVNVLTIKEVKVTREPIAKDVAVAMAKAELEQQISKELTNGADLQKETIYDEKIDEDTVKVTLCMDFIEKIGTEEPIIVNEQE